MFTLVCRLLHIQHGDLDVLLSKQVHDNLADAVTPSRYDNHLLTPHVRVARPIVRDCIVEPCADLVQDSENEQRLQMFPCGCMVSSGATTVDCILSSQEERQGKQRVQRRELKEAHKGVAGETWACVNHTFTKARRVHITYLHAQDSTRS
jgi:hypothetical protein